MEKALRSPEALTLKLEMILEMLLGRILNMFRKKKDRVKKNKNESYDYPLERLQGREMAYITARDDTSHEEIVLCKNAAINITDDELIILCNNRIVFRQKLANLKISDLMSLNGVVIRDTDAASKGHKVVTAYFKYHRK